MSDVGFSRIQLTPEELAAFDSLSESQPVEVPRRVCDALHRYRLVRISGPFRDVPPDGLVLCSLSPDGARFHALRSAAAAELAEKRRKEEAERQQRAAADEAKETTRLRERGEDIARDERHHKEQKMVTIRTTVFSCIVTGVVSFLSGLVLAYALHLFGL